MVEAKLSSMDLDKRVVVGEEVGTVPSQASGSWNPLTIKRAFGLRPGTAIRVLRLLQQHATCQSPAWLDAWSQTATLGCRRGSATP